jgi:two-component sensor histidine kinase
MVAGAPPLSKGLRVTTKGPLWTPPGWLMQLPAFRTIDAGPFDARLVAGYAAALLVFAVAFGLRLAIGEALPPGFPFLTFFPAVIITAFVYGLWPGVLVASLSTAACWFVFLPPEWSWVLSASSVLALGFFMTIVSIDIVLIHAAQVAVRHVQALRSEAVEAVDRQTLFVAELDHRIKNLFGTVTALATMSARHAKTPADLAQDLRERLGALAAVSGLLRGFGVASRATMDETVRRVVAPMARDGDFIVAGESLSVDMNATVALSLIFHELGTNAVKHGAWTIKGGRVAVSIGREAGKQGDMARVVWRETGGPLVSPPTRRGFGSVLLERTSRGLGGGLTLDHAPEGLVVVLTIPLIESADEAAMSETRAEPAPLAGGVGAVTH